LTTENRLHSIGVFDSGVGGLTVLSSITDLLPDYNFIYLGDNARVPYGTRSFETVYKYTLEGVKKLYELGCRLIIIACNTASAKALRTIQQNDLFKFPEPLKVLGVIRPTVETIGGLSKTKHIGIFATSGTVNSESYLLETHKLFPDVKVFQESCPIWVSLIEQNEFNNEGGEFFIKKNCENLISKSSNIDTIILGCTHYPIIKEQIKKYIPQNISVISQGEIVAKSLKNYLERHPEIEKTLAQNEKQTFFTTENPKEFNKKSLLFINKHIESSLIVL